MRYLNSGTVIVLEGEKTPSWLSERCAIYGQIYCQPPGLEWNALYS